MSSEKEHTWLMCAIAASVGLTVFLAGIVFAQIEGLNETTRIISEDIGYIKGIISQWETYLP